MNHLLASALALSLCSLPLSLGATAIEDDAGDVGIQIEAPCFCKPYATGRIVDGTLLVNVTTVPSEDCTAGTFVGVNGGELELVSGCEDGTTCLFIGTVTIDLPGSNPYGDIYDYNVPGTSVACGRQEWTFLDWQAQVALLGTPRFATFVLECRDCAPL
jgi:hypothetical protein